MLIFPSNSQPDGDSINGSCHSPSAGDTFLTPRTEEQFELLIRRCREGCVESQNQLAELISEQFYAFAHRLCGRQPFTQSLNASNLLNETFLRLVKAGVFREPKSRNHILGTAAKTMRHVVIDYLRSKHSIKRSPPGQRVYLDHVLEQLQSETYDHEDLNEALDLLESLYPLQAEIVHLRFFFGMTMEEIAEKCETSVPQIKTEWRKARAWLYKQLQ